VNLEDVVHHGHQFPLAVDLLLSSEGEALDADGLAEIAEDRLDDAESPTVDVPAKGGVDLLSHPFERSVLALALRQGFEQDVDLTGAFLTGAAQAVSSQLAGIAVSLVPHELHEDVVADSGPRALEPQRLTGGADAGLLFGIGSEVLYPVAPLA